MKEGFAQEVSRNMTQPRFLDAEWRMLAMLNYEIDSGVVSPLVPAGTTRNSMAPVIRGELERVRSRSRLAS